MWGERRSSPEPWEEGTEAAEGRVCFWSGTKKVGNQTNTFKRNPFVAVTAELWGLCPAPQ